MSGQLRVAVAAGYAVLLAVNGIFGSGAFGVPTNAEVSDAYPTNVTPAGVTFAIWGPIFLLQGAGTVLMAAGKAPMLGSKVAPLWLATWAFECAWQLVFANAPLADGKATGTTSQKLAVFVPSFFLLAGGFASMIKAGSLIRGGTAAEALLVALPTGINAAWLAAATGIGFTLVAQNTAPALASPEAGAVLLGGVVLGACYAVPTFLGRSAALGLGYGAATCWACFGMTKGDSPQVVKDVATYGGYLVAVVSAGALILRPRPPPPADGLLSSEAPKRSGSV
jgi:hypothetical protein